MSTDTRYSVCGEWFVQEANGCTCYGGDAHYGHEPGCGYEPLIKMEELKAALAGAGYAVVELPAPAGMDDDGQIWFDTTEIRVDTTGHEPVIWRGRNQWTVQQLRAEAAEFLSIAALVDAINAAAEVEK